MGVKSEKDKQVSSLAPCSSSLKILFIGCYILNGNDLKWWTGAFRKLPLPVRCLRAVWGQWWGVWTGGHPEGAGGAAGQKEGAGESRKKIQQHYRKKCVSSPRFFHSFVQESRLKQTHCDHFLGSIRWFNRSGFSELLTVTAYSICDTLFELLMF